MKLATDFEGIEKGIWAVKDDGNSDCHIYSTEEYLVLGQNKDYKEMVGANSFTPLCVVFEKDGTVHVQYKDAAGECKTRAINVGDFYKLFVRFLEDCKAYAVSNS